MHTVTSSVLRTLLEFVAYMHSGERVLNYSQRLVKNIKM